MDSRKTSGIVSQPELFAGRFEILAHLGTGLVGEVRRARDTQDPNDKDGGIALKILRPGQDPSLIKSEALTLQTLWLEEEKLKDGFHAAPHLLLADPGAEEPFLAMEFIRGKQIPDLLRESDARHFDEPTALNAAMQLFRILSVLHEGLNKTFIDLKMENLWWQEENGVRLRVTDWNVLEERHPIAAGKTDPVLIDIFRASVSLYWMLTGELPDLQGNLKVRRLQRTSNWGELSDGAKNLLSRLFSRKFETAMQVQRELERLLQYWKTDVASLVSKAKEFVLNDVEKASEIVSILRKRNTQPDKDFGALENVLKETWSQRDDPTKSISLFSAGSYSTALALIENAYPHTSQPHVFRWWRQAVELTSKLEYSIKKSMQDLNSDEKVERIREIVVKSVNAYFSQQYADAEQYFSKLTHDLPDEQEIKRIYGELLDVLMGLQFYEQAESQREQANDEDAETRRGLYKKAMDDYEQARLIVLTVPPVLLPKTISPASLEDSINELLNEIKVLSKAAKGKQYFKKGQIELAMDVWREGFRLDPDHPELMDFVMSAASEKTGKGAFDEALMLLKIIPMSGYSFACTALRKKINDARQKQMEQNELASNLEARADEQKPLDVPKVKEANSEVILARSAKSLDLARSREIMGSTEAKGMNDKTAIKKLRTNYKTSDHKTITSKVALAKVSEEKASATVITNQTQKSKPYDKKREAEVGDKARSTQSVSKLLTREDELKISGVVIKIFNRINEDKNDKKLTIESFKSYITKAKKVLLNNQGAFIEEERKRLDENEKNWHMASELFKEAQFAPLEKRGAIAEKLKGLGFVGEKTIFEDELGLSILDEFRDSRRFGPKFIIGNYIKPLLEQDLDEYKRKYVEDRLEEEKQRWILEVQTESVKEYKFQNAMELKSCFPDDPTVQEEYGKMRSQFLTKPPPASWKGIDYYEDLAYVNPYRCKADLINYKKDIGILALFGEDVEKILLEIDLRIGNNSQGESLINKLNAAYMNNLYPFPDRDKYANKIREILQEYRLQSPDWSLNKFVELFGKLVNRG